MATTPISFKQVSLDDVRFLQEQIAQGGGQISDYSVANIFGWQPVFDPHYAMIDDTLVFRHTNNGNTVYSLPTLTNEKATTPERQQWLLQLFDRLYANACLCGHDLTIYNLTPQVAKLYAQHAHGSKTIELRDNAGYLYSRDQLATLAGRHLQAKRNHLNRFRKLYPTAQYHTIGADDLPRCLAFATGWHHQHVEQYPEQKSSADAELAAIHYCLSHRDELSLISGMITIDDEIVAITYGCPINHETIDTCLEKARTDIEGAYTAINQQFAEHLPDNFIFINREEDLGLPGLRKAKLSYRPERLLARCLMHAPQCPTADFAQQCRQMWSDTFSDDPRFIDLYFKNLWTQQRTIYSILNSQLHGALHLIPYTLKWHDQQLSAAYLSGMAVAPAIRHQGIGRQLMRSAHLKAFRDQQGAILLIAANETTAQWYETMGYARVAQRVDPPQGLTPCSYDKYYAWERQQPTILLTHSTHYITAMAAQQLDNNDTAATEQEPMPAMLRITNSEMLLNAYAAQHPSLDCYITLEGDNDIPTNNGTFHLCQGHATHTPPRNDAQCYNLTTLAQYLFGDDQPRLCMMMDR